MLDLRRSVRVAATVGLALVTLATTHLSTQSRSNGRSLTTVVVDGLEAVEGEVLVRYRAEAGVVGRQRAEFDVDSDEVETVGRRGARRIRSRRLGTREMLQALRNNPDVDYAEPNYIIRLTAVPNEPWFGSLWGLFNSGQIVNGSAGVPGADIDAPGAWAYTTGSRANVVGVIDTGIDYNHPDLAANIWSAPRAFSVTIGGLTITCGAGTHGFNAILNSCNPMDDHSHGTHVAGTIGAVGNNGVGVAGVSWVASMMGLKFLSAGGSGATSDAIKAIEFAIQAKAALGIDANVRILSNSWGGGGHSIALGNQIEAANTADMLFVAAAGNAGTNNDVVPHWPSSYPNANVVSVASSTNRDVRSSFSNYGVVSVDLAAPGSNILSTVPNGGYVSYSGTSMATPHVAGAAALVLGECPMDTASLKSLLLSTVDLPAALAGFTQTGGRLDVNTAIQACRAAVGPPAITVDTLLVSPGGTISFAVANGPGNATDWIGFYAAGAADNAYQQWRFLNGTQSLPASGRRNASLQLTAPLTPGTYEIRWFSNGGYTRLATSSAIAVQSQPTLTINDVTVTEGNSGTVNATFTVTMSPVNPSQTVTVGYGTSSGTASGVSDYVVTIGTLTFPPSVATRTIAVPVRGDTTFEPNENFFVNLSNVVNAAIGDAQGMATIVTDDAPPSPVVTLSSATVNPGGTIDVRVANGPGNPMDWIGLYAVGADDRAYQQWKFLNGAQTPPASGLTAVWLQLTAPQTPGTYEIRWFANGGYSRLATSAPVTVQVQPTLRINDVSLNEGDGGTTTATFTVTLSPPNATQTVTAAYATTNGTATTANGDYVAASGTVTFAPSVTTRTITVILNGDTTPEPDETFFMNLSSPVNAGIGDAQGLALVRNDDAPPGAAVTIPTPNVSPGALIPFTVSNGPGNTIDWVAFSAAGADDRTYQQWQFLNGIQSPPTSGLTSAALQFTAPQAPGTYNIRFFANGGYTRLATSATITVGAPSPTITINDVSVTEANSGSANATFTVTISPVNASQSVTVDYATANGTATTADNDYLAASGTLTFAPSVDTQTITVPIVGDTAVEVNETFVVNLSNATNAAISDAQGSGTIVNDDVPPCSPCAAITVQSTTVNAGAIINFQVVDGPGNVGDWVGLYAVSSADRGEYVQWKYLSGSQSPPTAGRTGASLQFVAPSTPGTYNIRWFANHGYTKLATSVAITVLP
jgi:subtilisin family serine protease